MNTKYTLEEAIELFKEAFNKIKGKEIPSNRILHTGIGKTFEDVMNIVENNSPKADFLDLIEFKSHRELSKSMVTMFTLSPKPDGTMPRIRDTYGHPDKEYPNRKVIHCTVKHSDFTPYKNLYAYKLEFEDDKLKLLIKDTRTEEIVENSIYWNICDLKNKFNEKCINIAYIDAGHRKVKGQEYFVFKKATLLYGLTAERFIELIKKDIFVFDIRIGVYRSGKRKGMSHDHGPAFRIKKPDIPSVFKMEVLC